MSKPKNRLAQFQAQDFQADVRFQKVQKLRGFLSALAAIKKHGIGEFTQLPDGTYEVGDRCHAFLDVMADVFGLDSDTIFSEVIISALERFDRECGEEGLSA